MSLGPRTVAILMPRAASQNAPLTPGDGAGPAAITVTLNDGASSPVSPRGLYIYVDNRVSGRIPSVFAVTPYGGPDHGGDPVKILGAGFTAHGPDQVTAVTFGGVRAKIDRITGRFSMTVTPPRYRATGHRRRDCVTAGKLSPKDAMCQVQVEVFNRHGHSRTEQISRAYQGAMALNALYVVPAPAGCHCEIYPRPSEYDYTPAPIITSVSTSKGTSHYARRRRHDDDHDSWSGVQRAVPGRRVLWRLSRPRIHAI